MRLTAPTLRVREVKEILSFYERDMGLISRKKYRDSEGFEIVELGFAHDSDPLLVIKSDPGAETPSPDFAGLYHYAVLLPDRKGLASTFLAVGKAGVSYEGFADHSFSESLYLHDVEMNGMELYADRPRETWPDWGKILKASGVRGFAALNKPLDVDSLIAELNSEERTQPSLFPRGAKIGHMHLRVTNLARSVEFYHKQLGLDIMANMPEIGAAFLSVGGYHHHLGLNTWQSLDGSPHTPGETGLEEFRMVLPHAKALDGLSSRFPDASKKDGILEITDPDGIHVTVSSLRHEVI